MEPLAYDRRNQPLPVILLSAGGAAAGAIAPTRVSGSGPSHLAKVQLLSPYLMSRKPGQPWALVLAPV